MLNYYIYINKISVMKLRKAIQLIFSGFNKGNLTDVPNNSYFFLMYANLFFLLFFGIILIFTSTQTSQIILSIGLTICSVVVMGIILYHFQRHISRNTLQRKLMGVFAKIPKALLVTDANGRVLFSNELMAQLLGITSGCKLFDVINNTQDKGLIHSFADLQASILTKPRVQSEVLINNKYWHMDVYTTDNNQKYFMWVCQDAFQAPDTIQNFTDIHALHNYRSIFEFAPVGIVVLDQNFKIIRGNKKFRMDIAGSPDINDLIFFDGLLEESHRSEVIKMLQKIFDEDGSDTPIEISFKNGKTLSANCNRIKSTNDDLNDSCGLILHFFDNREQKALHQQLMQSQKMQAMGQLAGGIAHDFNNLLTAIIGFCDLLLSRHSPSDQSFTDLMQIKQNANRAANLVRQLLAFSKQQTLQPQVLNISEALSELTVLLQRLVGINISLDIIHGRDLSPIKVDKGQFEQVIVNLAVNARDAIQGEGKITINTSIKTYKRAHRVRHDTIPAGDYIAIEVSDTGTGIEEQHLEQIFDPFFSTKELGHGTGLGLSTVYGIIKQTGGYIFVNTELGKGSKFIILFPAHLEEEATEEQLNVANEIKQVEHHEAMSDTTGQGTILFVEDEDSVRLFGARALKDKGYKIIEARNGEEALGFVRSIADRDDATIDLMITDVVMPGMDGPELVKNVHEVFPGLKVIYISGYAEDSFRQRVGNEANIRFLPKPFSLKALALKVKEVMSDSDIAPKSRSA